MPNNVKIKCSLDVKPKTKRLCIGGLSECKSAPFKSIKMTALEKGDFADSL